jgi:hypothetical protein
MTRTADDTAPDPREEDEPLPVDPTLDPDALRDAHGKTGKYLKQAGLPFEDEEFDDSAPGHETPDDQ